MIFRDESEDNVVFKDHATVNGGTDTILIEGTDNSAHTTLIDIATYFDLSSGSSASKPAEKLG